MKPIISYLAAFVLLALTPTLLRAQTSGTFQNLTIGSGGSPGTLTVTGTGAAVDFQLPTMMLGTWSEGGSGAGLTLNFTDGATTYVNFIGSGTSTIWQWSQFIGSGSTLPSMLLNQSNQLVIYSPGVSGTTGITLDPSSSGTSIFSGNVTIKGSDNELPNQTFPSASSILTQGRGDARYMSGSYAVVGTGTDQYGNTVSSFGLFGGDASGPGAVAIYASTASGTYSIGIGVAARAYGIESLATGVGTLASGDYSTAIGNYATASALMSLAIAPYSTASAQGASALGQGSTASGDQSVAVGLQSQATANESMTFGNYAIASGDYAMAVGYGSTATNWFSYAYGFEANATGPAATASGYQSTASAYFANSIGALSTANGQYTTALGYSSTATGSYSAAGGAYTTSNGYGQFVVGMYNIPQGNSSIWTGTDNLFVVGNGLSVSGSSNAFVVNQNGDTAVMGALTVSGTSGNVNTITYGGLVMTGTSTPVVVGSGTVQTVVATGSTNLLLVPQQGDLSMGVFVAGQQPATTP